MPVLLKDFDVHFKKSGALFGKFYPRLAAQPKVWTQSQAEDLKLLADAVSSLFNAVGEMAARVRDD
jgi:hypothetical protein